MDERAEFEAWAKQAGWPHHATMPINKGTDYFSDMSLAVWQAATLRQQERIAYVEKIAEDAIELCTQQANRVMELEAQVQALSVDAGRWRFAASHNAEGRLNFGVVYDAWDGDGSFTDQIDAAIAAGKGEV